MKMSITQELRDKYAPLWERMVGHPFVQELVEGTLPQEKFRRYFRQDYLFLKALSSLLALAIAKAPDFPSARRLSAFLDVILTGEEELFQRSFRQMGVAVEKMGDIEPLPACRAFADYLLRLSYEGDFYDILVALSCVEGTYLDWAQRAKAAGKRPSNPTYREWIDIHADPGLADFVSWLRDGIDKAGLESRLERVEGIFRTCLRYEIRFWEMAYRGEQWPR